MKKALVLIVVLITGAVVVSALAGCGGDDELSGQEFLAQANEICSVGNAEIEANFEALFAADEEPTEEDVLQVIEEQGQGVLDDFVGNVRGQLDDIRDLNGPSDLESDVDSVLDDASEILDRVSEAGPEAFFADAEDEFAELDTKLLAIGLDTCAE